MARTYEFVVGPSDTGLRLDRYLTQRLPATISRGMIQRGVREGTITISHRAVKAHHKLRPGELVVASFTELAARSMDAALTAQAIPLDVVYEDDSVLVVNKPPGLVTHPAPGHWDGTLVNAVLWHLQVQGSRFKVQGRTADSRSLEPRTSNLEPPLPRAGIVHRLDKDTSGLLLIAKTDAAHFALAKQLKDRTLSRRYLALVEGHVPLDRGIVDAAIGRHTVHRKVMTVRHLGGRAAVTRYRVIRRFRLQQKRVNVHPPPSTLNPPINCTLLEVSLETGRTHQIRVHMAHLGYPVVGDPAYGKRPGGFWASLGIARQWLHAYQIRFVHPATERQLDLTAPLPEDLARWLPADLSVHLRPET